jgi:hypothetical protein
MSIRKCHSVLCVDDDPDLWEGFNAARETLL